MDRTQLEARAMEFAVAVKGLCDELRQQAGAWNVAQQLLNASTSMSANYRATSRSRSRAEWISKLAIVAEEADESLHWLEFVEASQFAPPARVAALLTEAKELRNIFAAAYATSRRNERGRRHSTKINR